METAVRRTSSTNSTNRSLSPSMTFIMNSSFRSNPWMLTIAIFIVSFFSQKGFFRDVRRRTVLDGAIVDYFKQYALMFGDMLSQHLKSILASTAALQSLEIQFAENGRRSRKSVISSSNLSYP